MRYYSLVSKLRNAKINRKVFMFSFLHKKDKKKVTVKGSTSNMVMFNCSLEKGYF